MKVVSRYVAFMKLGSMVSLGVGVSVFFSFVVAGIVIEIFPLSYEADLGWLMFITTPIIAPYWVGVFADQFVDSEWLRKHRPSVRAKTLTR